MTTQGSGLPGPNEMLDAWRQAASELETRYNDFFNQMMGTDGFAQFMARSMDGYLAMQSTLARGMEQYLRALNVPTRTDILQLGERLSVLEQQIETLSFMLAGAQEPNAAPRRAARNGTSTGRRGARAGSAAEGRRARNDAE